MRTKHIVSLRGNVACDRETSKEHTVLSTAWQVRKALGETYNMLREQFDPRIVERDKTASVGHKIFNKKTDVCAACGKQGKGLRLEAAHIVPLEECGETIAENIVPLCRRPRRKGGDAGCHQLFDSGYGSVKEVQQVRFEWRNRTSRFSLRELMVQRYAKHLQQQANIGSKKLSEIQALLSRGATVKAIKEAKRQLDTTTDEKDAFSLKLKIIEIMRRRSASGALEKAAKDFNLLSSEAGVPPDLAAWFHYEGGYINMLLGQYEIARRYFQESLDAITKGSDGWEGKWVSAASVLVQSTIALKGSDAPLAELERTLSEARRIAKCASETHGKRWVASCNWHLVKVNFVKNDIQAADSCWRKAQQHWHDMTVLDGWSIGFRPTILTITGELLSEQAQSSSDAKNALRYLTRGLVLLVGASRRHFEGVRDLLFGTAHMLHFIGKDSHAKRVENIASRTRDGCSWRFPYRQSN